MKRWFHIDDFGAGCFGLILVVAVLGLLLLTTAVYAHEWYDYDCCAENHCHPVLDGVVRDSEDGGVDVKGFEHLERNSSRLRQSQDSHDHLCTTLGVYGSIVLNCVYHVRRIY